MSVKIIKPRPYQIFQLHTSFMNVLRALPPGARDYGPNLKMKVRMKYCVLFASFLVTDLS